MVSRILAGRASPDGRRASALAIMSIFAVIGVGQFVVTLLNWALTNLTMPDLLPRMDFSRGIPPELRTLVVVPTMLTTAESVARRGEALEVRFLATREDSVHVCLCSSCVNGHLRTS